MAGSDLFQLELELKRVQTFIFQVPRLKVMLGANALVGEAVRHQLSMEASKHALGVSSEHLPATDSKDPFKALDNLPESAVPDADDPAALYKKGILVRDGGRFKAVFKKETDALDFAKEAKALLAQSLPGVLFRIDCCPLGKERDEKDSTARPAQATEVHTMDLPVFQVCEESGSDVASHKGRKGKWAGPSVKALEKASDRFKKGETRDLVGLLRGPLRLDDRNWIAPDDLETMCGTEYLALIHADGNGVGKRYSKWREKCPGGASELEREAWGERFYYSMRVAVRKALVEALDATFEPGAKVGVRPFSVLMLGGDDLLLACRASDAPAFAVNYARALKPHVLADEEPLDVAIGVAIAKPSYPFHRLHELAEALAGSAKRLYRSDPTLGSVIDWQVVTASWFDDVAGVRKRNELIRYRVGETDETLVLTERPYAVLGQDRSLESLRAASAELASVETEGEEAPGRTAYRSLRSAFERGRLSATMAFERLPEEIRLRLALSGSDTPWHELRDGFWSTRVLDVIGLRELAHLGGANHDQDA